MSKTMEALKYNFTDYIDDAFSTMKKKKKNKKQKVFKYKGRKNETINPTFISLCKMPQAELKAHVETELRKVYPEVHSKDGFVYAKGTAPLLLTAHLDTVHLEIVKDFYEETKNENGIITHVLSSPQGIGGDDRCGVYIILEIISGIKDPQKLPSILFCEDEEVGGIGSSKFTQSKYIDELKELKFFVELDRRGDSDAVFYDCGNIDFQDWIMDQTKYKDNWGSFSDISILSPATDVASVNLSVGYHNEHTLQETVVLEEMEHTKTVVQNLICKSRSRKLEPFDYQNNTWEWGYDDYDSYGSNYYGLYNDVKNSVSKLESGFLTMEFFWYEKNANGVNTMRNDIAYGSSKSECIGELLSMYPYLCWNDIVDFEIYDK